MESFIFWIVVLMIIESVAKVLSIASNNIPDRTVASMSIDVLLATIFIIWGITVIN